jgi:transposase
MEIINCKIPNSCKFFLIQIESRFISSGNCGMTNKELAKLFSVSARTICRWIKCLKDSNIIRCEYNKSSHRNTFVPNRNE